MLNSDKIFKHEPQLQIDPTENRPYPTTEDGDRTMHSNYMRVHGSLRKFNDCFALKLADIDTWVPPEAAADAAVFRVETDGDTAWNWAGMFCSQCLATVCVEKDRVLVALIDQDSLQFASQSKDIPPEYELHEFANLDELAYAWYSGGQNTHKFKLNGKYLDDDEETQRLINVFVEKAGFEYACPDENTPEAWEEVVYEFDGVQITHKELMRCRNSFPDFMRNIFELYNEKLQKR